MRLTRNRVKWEQRKNPLQLPFERNCYFRSISQEVGVSRRVLARYNERDKDDVLASGDVVYLKKKHRKADKEFRNRPHTVRSGESMYAISQLYGIRLKSLYKLNHLDPEVYQIHVGDRLRVR